MCRFLIFSDIDNTLVQSYVVRDSEMVHSNGYGDIKNVIKILTENRIPLILCSTKTRKEQDKIRKDLDILDPYIVENGGAIIVPKNYFPFHPNDFGLETREKEGNITLELGKSYEQIVGILGDIREKFDFRFKCVSDFSISELANKVGISVVDAKFMASREYSETILEIESSNRKELEEALNERNLIMAQGTRYITVSARHDKGCAVSILKNLFYKKYKNQKIQVIAIGDAINDITMFENVDHAFLVRNIFNRYTPMEVNNLTRVNGIAQNGWKEVVLNHILDRNEKK